MGVECQTRVIFADDLDPSGGHPRRYKITLVKHKNKMFVSAFLGLEFFLNTLGASAHRISNVQNLNENITAVNHLPKLNQYPSRLTLKREEKKMATEGTNNE